MAKKTNPMHAVKAKSRSRTSSAIRPKKKKKKSKSFLVWLIVGILAIGGLGTFLFIRFQKNKPLSVVEFRKQAPEGFPTIGIDVSHHQGEIDWDKLFNHSRYDTLIHFVYCKATEGNTLKDRQWQRNRRILNDFGIPNGAYHFFITKEDPKPQAIHFLENWEQRDIDLPPVLDVETEGFSDEELIANMKVWLNFVEHKSGMRPIIYTSLHFYQTKFQEEFKNYKFWIAAYSRRPPCIEDERIIHWQYSETGRIPGTREKVDLNVSKIKF